MTPNFSVQIKSLVRFSYLGTSGAKRAAATEAQFKAKLFSAERLEMQFALFEYFTLPSLRQQTDKDFAGVILTSEDLPDAAMDRLLSLTESTENLSVVALAPLKAGVAMARAYRKIADRPGATHVATFRLEDDAAISNTAVAVIRHTAEAIAKAVPPDQCFAINFGSGYLLNLASAPGEPRLIAAQSAIPQVNGLTLVAPAGRPDHVAKFNHRTLGDQVSLFNDQSTPMYLKPIQSEKDTVLTGPGLRAPAEPVTTERQLKIGFGLSYQELENG